MVHPYLLNFFQKIEKDDGFISYDHDSLFENGSTYKDKGLFAKFLSQKSVMKNNENVSHSPISQQNQIFIDPKKGSFLKSFYGGQKLDPKKIHLSLLQNLQKIDEEDGKDNQFFSHKEKSFSERSSTCEHKEELDHKSDSCESRMDNGGQKGSPMHAPIAHQNNVSIDPNQVEFLKRFHGNAHLDPNKLHPSLL